MLLPQSPHHLELRMTMIFLLKGQVVLSDFAAFIFSLLNRALVV